MNMRLLFNVPFIYPSKNSFIHHRLQAFTAGMLFPVGKGDWYKNKKYGTDSLLPHEDFCQQQKNNPDAHYYKTFQKLDLHMQMVHSQLADGKPCQLESFICKPQNAIHPLPGSGKHILYFPGANTYYQACFRDIATAATETGATLHAFNFPGTGLSSGQVKEANDLTNAGLAMVKSLLTQGIHPDDIILQGDCFGAAIAMEVKEQIKMQTGIEIRLIMNNAFKSFKAAIQDMITASKLIPHHLKKIIKTLLQFTGWHVTPGKKFIHSSPYQCHIKHDSDLVLISSSLSDKVQRMRGSNKEKYIDTCPEEYKAARDNLERSHILKVRKDAKARLGNKFGFDHYGRVNAHFADLCELETQDGKPAYTGFINPFLESSNQYIAAHPQTADSTQLCKAIQFIGQATAHPITQKEAASMNALQEAVEFEQHFSVDCSFENKINVSRTCSQFMP